MIDPFENWSRLCRAGLAMQHTWLQAAETLSAANAVVSARTETMTAAARSPMTADLAELSRMGPEKLAAFGQGSLAFAAVMSRMQGDCLAQAQAMLTLLRLRPATPAELSTWGARSNAFVLGMIDDWTRAGAEALAPIHATATGNARRLAAKQRKAGKPARRGRAAG